MAESYKKEAKIEINAVFDDESIVKKLADSLDEISESSDKIESNVQESLGNAEKSFEDFDSAVDDSVQKLDEEQYKVSRTGDMFDTLREAKESAKNANLNFGDSAEEGSEKVDKEHSSLRDLKYQFGELEGFIPNKRIQQFYQNTQDLSDSQADLTDNASATYTEIDNLNNAFDLQSELVDENRRRFEIQGESFESLIRSASTLDDIYSAQSDSVNVLSDSTAEQRIEAFEQSNVFQKLKRDGADLIPVYEEIADKQTILKNVSGATKEELYGESGSLESIVDGGENAAQMKEKVSKANKRLGGITEETAKDLGIEGDAFEVLANAGLIASTATDEASDSSRSLSRTLSAVNESVDETGDSLRAAAEIGDIFEDGLGSLSVNLGAFTIALRNFFTQVPLLITALGAAAEAAAGAASAFIAVAGAIGSAIAAGAIARARQLKEEYSQIEELGQGVQVIFSNVRDTLLEAAEPAFNTETIELFKRAVEGTATVVNLLAQGVAELSNNQGAFDLQDAFDQLREDVLPSVVNVVDALIYSFETLGSETVAVLGIITQALADLIVKSTDFVARIDDLGQFVSQFRDTVASLSELGLAIGSGLIPVFTAFSNIMESLANTLNQVNDEVLGNVVTFGAFIFAVSRLSGVLSTVVTIVPNLAVGFGSLATKVNNANSAFKAFQATVVGANTRVAHFLSQISVFSGITALIGALGGTSERLRQIAFRSSSVTARLEALALGTNVTAQQLYELAVAEELSADMMSALQDEANDVKDEFRELQLQLALTDEQFDSLDGDFDVDVGELSDDLNDPGGLLDIGGGSFMSRFIGDSSEAESVAQQAGEAVINTFDREEGKFLSQESREFWTEGKRLKDAAKDVSLLETAQFDYGRATSFVNDKIRNNNIVTGSLLGTMKNLALSVKQAAVSTTALGLSFLKLIPNMLYTLATTRSLSKAFDVARNSQIGQAIASVIANSALLTYIASAISATIANYGLATSIAAVTGGLNILLALVGALAVGIITNFDKIKGSVDGAVSGIMPVLGALKDILLTVFVETWNIIVSAVSSLKTIFDPFITLIKSVAGIFGLLAGGAKEGGDSLSIVTVAANILVGALQFVSDAIQALFAVIAVLGKTLSLVLVTPLKIVVGLLRGFAELVGQAFDIAAEEYDLFSGIENLIELINDVRTGFDEIPETIESFVNKAIGYINGLIEKINQIPIVNIEQIEEIEVTGGGLETDRDELATDTAQAREGLSQVAANTINMKTENNQTVNQTVNADPEDKSTVSRVVEDAIERANRFERGRAAGQ